jgi:hypothetical protein
MPMAAGFLRWSATEKSPQPKTGIGHVLKSRRRFVLYGTKSLWGNHVFAVSPAHPPGSDQVPPGLYGTNRVTASGMIEPVISEDKVSVKLSLTQCSAHFRRQLCHPSSCVAAAKVPIAQLATRRNRLTHVPLLCCCPIFLVLAAYHDPKCLIRQWVAATPWPHPTERASRHRALRRS